MTLPEIEGPLDVQRTRETLREWRKRPANTSLTNGRLLASRLVWTFCLTLAAFVGYRQIRLDSQVTRDRIDATVIRQFEACQQANILLDKGKQVAEGNIEQDQQALNSERLSWQSIDELFPKGLPEPTRTVVFTGLQDRQEAIITQSKLVENVFKSVPCDPVAGGESNK